jgi:hypothetical protein
MGATAFVSGSFLVPIAQTLNTTSQRSRPADPAMRVPSPSSRYSSDSYWARASEDLDDRLADPISLAGIPPSLSAHQVAVG